MLRLRVAAATFALAVVGLCVPSSAAAAAHPYFDDRGTLEWYRSLDEAQTAARRTGKLIFIDSGRLRCGNCRTLIGDVVPSPRVRERMARIAIGLSDEIDRPDPRVMQILERGVPNAEMLPLVGFVTPELRWVTGWSGHMDVEGVCGYLAIAEQRWQQVQTFRARTGAMPAPLSAPAQRPLSTEPKPVAPRPAVTLPAQSPAPSRHDDGGCELPSAARARAAAPAPPRPVEPPVAPTVEPRALRSPPAPTPTPVPPLAESPRPPVRAPAMAKSLPLPVAAVTPPSTGTLLSRVRAAAATARYGEVIRLGETERPSPGERAEFDALVQRAHTWVLSSMAEAEAAARARRLPEAMRTLAVVRSELHHTQCPALTDAERGERAVRCLIAIERGSPDSKGTPEELRKQAYADFRGTRWAALFRSRA